MAIIAGDEVKASEVNTELNKKVNNTGNEAIAGIKTFSSIPVLPAANPTTDNQATRKKYIDDNFSEGEAGTGIVLAAANTERVSNSLTYEKLKEIEADKSGEVKVSFDFKAGADGPLQAYARIYKNGVAFGTERTREGSNYVTYSEDLTFAKGDLIQLYAKVTNVDYDSYVKNFNVKIGFKGATVITD